MGNILVTGVGGFIGSHMVEYLQEKGHDIRRRHKTTGVRQNKAN